MPNPNVALVVDASVGLKGVLQEADSPPDFWLHEACNVLWPQVRRKLFAPNEAREALALLRAQVEPTPTAELSLHIEFAPPALHRISTAPGRFDVSCSLFAFRAEPAKAAAP